MSAVLRPQPLLRPMTEDDVDAVWSIEQQEYPFPWRRRIFSDCLKMGYPATVLEWSGVVVGYGLLSVGADEAHVLNVCVARQWQRRGCGDRLVRRLLQMARWAQAREIFLEVRASNPVAYRLYQRLGFREIGRRKDYYPAHGGREDALVMSYRFGPGLAVRG